MNHTPGQVRAVRLTRHLLYKAIDHARQQHQVGEGELVIALGSVVSEFFADHALEDPRFGAWIRAVQHGVEYLRRQHAEETDADPD